MRKALRRPPCFPVVACCVKGRVKKGLLCELSQGFETCLDVTGSWSQSFGSTRNFIHGFYTPLEGSFEHS